MKNTTPGCHPYLRRAHVHRHFLALLAGVFCVLATPLHTAAGALFGPATNFAAGTNPFSVAVVDVNGDGKPDIVTANYSSNNVGVLLNTTASGDLTPTFAAATTFPVGTGPRSVAVVDVNGDGKPDIVTANYGINNVSVLLGDGTGSFGPATNFAVGTGPYSVAVVDVNGDGKPDIVTANEGTANVSVLLGTGTASFGPATNFPVGAFPRSVAVVDVNGDGKPDIITANYDSHNVSVLLGDGTGSFGAATNFAVGAFPYSVAVVDVNGDGKPDIVTANEVGNVSVRLGTGTGSFGAATNFTVGSGPVSVAVVDVNGDGKPDIVTANKGSNNVSVRLGTGTGSFGAATNFAVGSVPNSVAVMDVNGDGKPDIVTANKGSANVSVLLGGALDVTPSAGANGTISPRTVQAVNSGGSVAFTATPADGYTVDQWLVNSAPVQTGGTGYTVTNVTANTTVQVTFAQTPIGSWRQLWFGSPANSGPGADTADPDGDGFTNLFEYVAGLNPTSAASLFSTGIAPVPGQPGQEAITFGPIVAGRTYVVTGKASLTDPAWLALTSFTTAGHGTQRTVTDTAAGGGTKFYRVEITLP